MQVYLVMEFVEYEYTEVVGIYLNKQAAYNAVDELEKKSGTAFQSYYVEEQEVIDAS